MCNKDNIDIVIMYVYVWYGRGVYWVVLICYRKGIVLDCYNMQYVEQCFDYSNKVVQYRICYNVWVL